MLFSSHARMRMAQRGISVEEVKMAVRQGSKQIQKPDKLLYHFRHFSVVTKKVKGKVFVITVKPRW
jgi:uncharacterized OsmC-like protein